jgi:hypothetical protein
MKAMIRATSLTILSVVFSVGLLFNTGCGSTGASAEGSENPAGAPTTLAVQIKENIKRGDQVTVTQKDGTVHRFKVSKVDDAGVHGRDDSRSSVSVPFNNLKSLAVVRGGTRAKTDRGYNDGSGGVDAGKVAVGAGYVGAFLLYAGYGFVKGLGDISLMPLY